MKTLKHLAPIAIVALVAMPLSAQTAHVVSVASFNPCSDASASQPTSDSSPFGAFDGPNGGGNGASGVVGVTGWALADDGIAYVDVTVDGAVVGRADFGTARPDVNAVYPGYPNSAFAGYNFFLDTTHFQNGQHDVSARAVSSTGLITDLAPKTLLFTNSTHTLRPFGEIEFPNDNADLFGNCDPESPDRRYSVIEGWVLDAGVELNDHGVGYVELLIDGSRYANSRLDCRHSLATGTFTDCYGVRDLEIEDRYPTLRDAPNAGFRFVLDVGALIDFGYANGHHTLTIRSGDIDSQVANVDTVNVNFWCDDFLGNEGSLGAIEGSLHALSSGTTQFEGWALDWEGVVAVQVYIDGVFEGNAVYGFPRADIAATYPGYPDTASAGWIFPFDTHSVSNGEHQVTVIVQDFGGNLTTIGEATFDVLNP